KTIGSDLDKTLKSALAPLSGAFASILAGVDKFIKASGPMLRDLFKASLPFLQMFAGVLEQAAKIILPAVTQSLKQLAPFRAVIAQGFTALCQGIANMIAAIGPRGMRDSAKVFVGLMKAMGEALTILGKVFNFAAVAALTAGRRIHQNWNQLRHDT